MAVLLLLTFPQLYGDQANLLNSILSAKTNFDGDLPSIQEGQLLTFSVLRKGVVRIRTISLDSWIHVGGYGVRNKPAFGSCNLPLQEGFTGQLWHPATRISPGSTKFGIVKSPFVDVKRYVESKKYRAWRCWGGRQLLGHTVSGRYRED